MECISHGSPAEFPDNIKYCVSWRHCCGSVLGEHQAAGGMCLAHCRNPSQRRKRSIWSCFWMTWSIQSDLKEGTATGNKGIGGKGESQGALQVFGSEDCCSSRSTRSFENSSGSQDCRSPIITHYLLRCKGEMRSF